MDTLERRTMAKVFRRLMPLLIVCYCVAYLDRVNVGFSALEMNSDLGLTASAFGFGAGIFFLTYFFFEVPSNLMLTRFGARRWFARILFSWGLVSCATALVTGPTSFYAVRLLLGAAEAGFFPGVAFFLSQWFPSAYRARVMSYFLFAAPLSSVIGSPISGALLGMHGFMGLHGWQWLFILEGLPALVLAAIVLAIVADRPAEAKWLGSDERAWLGEQITGEQQNHVVQREYGFWEVLINPRVLLLALVHFGLVLTIYGVGFFLPQIIKEFGGSNLQTSFIATIPYFVAMVGIIVLGKRSDSRMERRFHTVVPVLVAGIALAAAALVHNPSAKVIAFSIAAFGSYGALPAFWAIATNLMPGKTAAASIAVIAALGNLGGFVGPFIMGLAKDHTGNFTSGLLILAAAGVVAGLIVLVLGRASLQNSTLVRGSLSAK
ncbi:MFS transporter [Paraburkholderia sp. MM5384-R2]|uniref:MFS transporter n=1 Tax=Paraburkholderia sp. MM5384-R2 TaxID=2723097 RepID=UPI00160D65B6|nr:MFS transporter [Paraburkholderia sp. MM5384-R2]MBB5498843.1 D-galactonate transporter [Paraburkholderia sp. MM5384-R2]